MFVCTAVTVANRWFAAQRYYVHKTCFQENRKDTKVVVCPIMLTYDIVLLTPALDY